METIIWTIIILLALLCAVTSGYATGFLVQLKDLVGFIIGVLVARTLTPLVITMLGNFGVDTSSLLVTIICYILVFFAAFLIVVFLAGLLKFMVKAVSLNVVDRLAGALFKLVKWTLIISLVYNLCVSLSICSAPNVSGNWLQKTVYNSAPAMLDLWQQSAE